MVDYLLYATFRLTKNETGKYSVERSYKGTGNVTHLARLFGMSPLLKEELRYFVKEELLPIMMNKYQIDLGRYLSSIAQRTNYFYES